MLVVWLVTSLLLSLLTLSGIVDCSPYQVQPRSVNTTVGSVATFTVIACNINVNRLVNWGVDKPIYPSNYSVEGDDITVVTTRYNDECYQSTLSIENVTFKYNNNDIEISVTTYTPMAVISDTVYLNVQGPLNGVTELHYNVTSNWLSWIPPPTLIGVPIDYYYIRIIETDSHTLTAEYKVQGNNTDISLADTNFTSCRMYNISVVGANGAGNGTTSKLTYIHTGMIRARLSQQPPVISLLSNTSTILYQVQYNCAGEVPVSVYGVIRRNDDTDDIQYDNQLISVYNNSNVFNGSYTIDGLIHNSYYEGHLVFTSMSGLTSNSESFEIWTFDVDTVDISVNTSNGLCVRVTYTNGSDAIGYNMRIINRHIADETTSLNVTKYVNEYCQSLSGGHYTIQVYDWESNNTISFNWRYEYNITMVASPAISCHIDDTRIDTINATSECNGTDNLLHVMWFGNNNYDHTTSTTVYIINTTNITTMDTSVDVLLPAEDINQTSYTVYLTMNENINDTTVHVLTIKENERNHFISYFASTMICLQYEAYNKSISLMGQTALRIYVILTDEEVYHVVDGSNCYKLITLTSYVTRRSISYNEYSSIDITKLCYVTLINECPSLISRNTTSWRCVITINDTSIISSSSDIDELLVFICYNYTCRYHNTIYKSLIYANISRCDNNNPTESSSDIITIIIGVSLSAVFLLVVAILCAVVIFLVIQLKGRKDKYQVRDNEFELQRVDHRVPPTVPTTDDHVPPTVPTTDDHVPPTVPTTDDQAPPTIPTTDDQAPPTVPTTDDHVPPTVPTTDDQVPPTVPTTDDHVPPTVPTTDDQVPPTVPTTDDHVPPTVPTTDDLESYYTSAVLEQDISEANQQLVVTEGQLPISQQKINDTKNTFDSIVVASTNDNAEIKLLKTVFTDKSTPDEPVYVYQNPNLLTRLINKETNQLLQETQEISTQTESAQSTSP